MREIINDKRYGALRTIGERKQAFNEVNVCSTFNFRHSFLVGLGMLDSLPLLLVTFRWAFIFALVLLLLFITALYCSYFNLIILKYSIWVKGKNWRLRRGA